MAKRNVLFVSQREAHRSFCCRKSVTDFLLNFLFDEDQHYKGQKADVARLCWSMYSDKSDPQPPFSNPTPRDFYEDGWAVWRSFTRKLIVLPHSPAPTSAIGFHGREYFTRNRNRIFCWAMKMRFCVAYPKTLFVICSIDICGGNI